MLITKVSLTNFASHLNNEFEFTPGINAIVGRNGSGKSSILNAIGLALFNAYSTTADFISYGHDTATVELYFSYAGLDYYLKRDIGRLSGCTLSYLNNEVQGVKEVYAYLTMLLDIDLKNYFLNALRIKSSSITFPFVTDNTKRKAIFDDILNLDKYSLIWEALREPQKIMDNRINELDKKIQFELGRISNWEQALKELDMLQHQLADLNQKQLTYKTFELEYDQRKLLIDTLAKREKDLINFKQQLEAELAKQQSLTANLCYICNQPLQDDKLEQLQLEVNKKIEVMSRFINGTTADLEHLRTEIKKTDDLPEAKNHYSELIKLEERIRLLKNQIDSYSDNNLDQLKILISKLNSKADQLKFIREGFKKLPIILADRHTSFISTQASTIMSDLMDRVVKVVFNSKYETQFYFDGNELNFNQLSEGEQIMAALSIRLAVIKIFGDFGLVFLDEPFISLDDTSRELLSENLKRLDFAQLFLITHTDDLRQDIDNLINL